uniref:Uncharacterized protein n=1 Tax=Arundo donax TaxID=35708 RepID=A0A0A9BHV1_ARUDO
MPSVSPPSRVIPDAK